MLQTDTHAEIVAFRESQASLCVMVLSSWLIMEARLEWVLAVNNLYPQVDPLWLLS